MAIRNWDGAIRADPTRSLELRRASWLSFDAAFGVGWPAFTPGAARACVARIDLRVTGEQQVCLRTTRCHAPTSEGDYKQKQTRDTRFFLPLPMRADLDDF